MVVPCAFCDDPDSCWFVISRGPAALASATVDRELYDAEATAIAGSCGTPERRDLGAAADGPAEFFGEDEAVIAMRELERRR